MTEEADRAHKFGRILESASDGIVTLDKEGRYTYANAAAERMLGLPRESILHRTFDQAEWRLSAVRGDSLSEGENPFQRVLHENKGVFGLKMAIERPDGERIVISASAAPLYDANGQFDGMVGIFTDVTELHKLQERTNAVYQVVARDLQIPLAVLLGHAEMLKEVFQKSHVVGSALRNVEGILEGAGKIGNIIQDLADTSRIEDGQILLEKEPIALEDFVWSLLRSARETMDLQRIATHIPANLPTVMADSARLERILINLLENALKFSPSDRKVILQAHKSGDEITISVSDQGEGIAPEDCSRLFRRLFQIKRSQPASGSGLGLYVCRLLVEAHGGRIWVESKRGEGSTFYFTLPVA